MPIGDYRTMEQIVSHIEPIQDTTFIGQIKNDSVFYRTGGDPHQ